MAHPTQALTQTADGPGLNERYVGACWDEFSVDGAMANICARVECQLREVVGATLLKPQDPTSYTSRRSKGDRPFIESFFGQLARGGFHRLSTTTGSTPADKRGADPDQAATETQFQLEYAEELPDTLIANYNARPHPGLGWRSPLAQLDFLTNREPERTPDYLRVIGAYFTKYNSQHSKKNKGVSFKTMHDRQRMVVSFFRELRHETPYRNLDPRQLANRHIEAMVARWLERRLSTATIHNYLSLRLNEVLKLRVDDVDLVQGVLRINDTKFGKDRLVPPALPLVQRLQKYAAEIGRQPADAYFFPSPRGGHWSSSALYWIFRELLMRCRISHGGRGQGPRMHDLRHTMAVHTLLRWYREGADLDARLPVLASGRSSTAPPRRCSCSSCPRCAISRR